jgi:hypothetical protein
MKATRLAVAVLLLLGALAMPSQAIILTCADICTCTISCYQSCRDDGSLQWTNCESTGTCIGGPQCTW